MEVDVEERNFLEGRRAFIASAEAASEAASEAGRKQTTRARLEPKEGGATGPKARKNH